MNLISFTIDTLTTFFVPGARLSAVDTPVSSKEYPYHNKTQSLTRLRTLELKHTCAPPSLAVQLEQFPALLMQV